VKRRPPVGSENISRTRRGARSSGSSGVQISRPRFRWSALRFDHRLLSGNPSGCCYRGQPALRIEFPNLSRGHFFPGRFLFLTGVCFSAGVFVVAGAFIGGVVAGACGDAGVGLLVRSDDLYVRDGGTADGSYAVLLIIATKLWAPVSSGLPGTRNISKRPREGCAI